MLKIMGLSVEINDKPILKSVSFGVAPSSIYALLGPNGSGKSTLAITLAGHPDMTVTGGSATVSGTKILPLEPEERAKAGLFVSFQSPVALPGVKITTFLRAALNARRKTPIDIAPFMKELRAAFKLVGLPTEFASRAVNDGFSGGERKRLELAQAILFDPKVVIFDEIDSGLDLDAVKIVARVVKKLKEQGKAVVVITHYPALLKTIAADHVGVIMNGQIAASGGPELTAQIAQDGFDQFRS